MIPRVIHQIWLGPHPCPEAWVARWRDMGWEHRLWREGDLAGLPLAQRAFDWYMDNGQFYGAANVARVAILLEHGGLYVDVDAEPLRDFDDAPFLDVGFVAGYEPNVPDRPGRIANGTMLAAPGHPVLVRYNELLRRARKLEPSWDTTGGTMLTRAVAETGGSDVRILPPRTFYPLDPHGRPAPGDEDSWTSHYWSSTNETYPHQAKRAVLLVPRRDDGGHRDRLWAWCKARWQRYFPDIPIYEGHHDDGPFNRAAAVNRAAAFADSDGRWDLGIVIDSDVFLKVSQVRAAIDTARRSGRVTWAHRRWREFHEDWTTRTLNASTDFGPELDSTDLDVLIGQTRPLSWSCCFVVPRAVWNDIGGMDERFIGWGFEDMAWQSLIAGLYGYERIEGDVINLWHPRSSERIIKGQGRSTATLAYITNARLGRRYMYAARRDHNVHDRPEVADEAERQRDMANLKLDDAKWSAEAKRHGLPDWDDWWPTLEELRDGAKAAKVGPEPSVTLIVHTDGRRDYIERSIASLREHVRGPIAKRVIYDDSGDPAYKRWLADTFGRDTWGEDGFYIVGPDKRLGYTGSMRAMWAYLWDRCSTSHVFQVEDDFVYDTDIDLGPMIETLDEVPYLRQLALLRAPYFPREIEAGTVLPKDRELQNHRPHPFITHRDHFTANPSLFRRDLTRSPWPAQPSSERAYTDLLNRDPASRFGYWGSGEPQIRHIGEVRAGSGY